MPTSRKQRGHACYPLAPFGSSPSEFDHDCYPYDHYRRVTGEDEHGNFVEYIEQGNTWERITRDSEGGNELHRESGTLCGHTTHAAGAAASTQVNDNLASTETQSDNTPLDPQARRDQDEAETNRSGMYSPQVSNTQAELDEARRGRQRAVEEAKQAQSATGMTQQEKDNLVDEGVGWVQFVGQRKWWVTLTSANEILRSVLDERDNGTHHLFSGLLHPPRGTVPRRRNIISHFEVIVLEQLFEQFEICSSTFA